MKKEEEEGEEEEEEGKRCHLTQSSASLLFGLLMSCY
jgi:hypothetical protein